jgi:hypothetical protein
MDANPSGTSPGVWPRPTSSAANPPARASAHAGRIDW